MNTPLTVALYSSSWKVKYLSSRYLGHLPQDDLEERYRNILRNAVSYALDGKPRFPGLDETTRTTAFMADLFAETDHRGLGAQWRVAIEDSVRLDPHPQAVKALEAWGSRAPKAGRFLVKYGKKAHLSKLVEQGELRVSLASTYLDPSLNPAIQDDELTSLVHFPPGTRLQVQLESGGYEDIQGIQGLLNHKRTCNDYYVFCASSAFDPRAFDDFKSAYDACVLIHDWEEFFNRIESQPAPGKKISGGSVVYLDPFNPLKDSAVMFVKHWRYAYQQEWRIIWEEPFTNPPPEHFYFQLGDLRPLCELVEI